MMLKYWTYRSQITISKTNWSFKSYYTILFHTWIFKKFVKFPKAVRTSHLHANNQVLWIGGF